MINIKKLPNGKLRLSVCEYDGLTPYEAMLIAKYHLDYDKSAITKLVESGKKCSLSFNRFVADLLVNKAKRRKIMKSQKRDFDIYLSMLSLMTDENLSVDVARRRVSLVYNLSPERVEQIFYAVRKYVIELSKAEEEIARLFDENP